jgi:hypothetical protein
MAPGFSAADRDGLHEIGSKGTGMDEAFRVTFEVGRDGMTLRSLRRLAMRAPAGEPQGDGPVDTPGRFVELRDADGAALYRRHIDHIIPDTMEFPSGDPQRPLSRGRPTQRPCILPVLVPVATGARSVAVVEVLARRPSAAGAKNENPAMRPRDIVSIDLP